jgi:hypothetical protein
VSLIVVVAPGGRTLRVYINYLLNACCRGREVSKGGRGPYNSGNVDQEALDAEKDPAAIVAEVSEELAENIVEGEVVPQEPVEEQVKTLTLEDFIRSKQASSSLFSTIDSALRTSQAVDDIDNSKGAKKDQRSSSKSSIADLGFKFDNPVVFRPRREENVQRGGRGGGRRTGRGAGRGDSRKPVAVNISDTDFPALN